MLHAVTRGIPDFQAGFRAAGEPREGAAAPDSPFSFATAIPRTNCLSPIRALFFAGRRLAARVW